MKRDSVDAVAMIASLRRCEPVQVQPVLSAIADGPTALSVLGWNSVLESRGDSARHARSGAHRTLEDRGDSTPWRIHADMPLLGAFAASRA